VLPADLDVTARECGALIRCRNVPSAANLIRLALAYALSDMSFKDVAAWANGLEIASISGPGLFYRVRVMEKWLERVLGQLLCEQIRGIPEGFILRVVDATVICGPGSKGTDWRAHVLFNPLTGEIYSVELTDGRGSEGYSRFQIGRGEVVLGDRAYCTARGIDWVVNAGAHVITRLNPHSIRVCDLHGQKIDLLSWEKKISKGKVWSKQVLVPVPPDKKYKNGGMWKLSLAKAWIPVRIVATRTPKGTVTWILTTLPLERISDRDLLKVYRLRWQIELFFKRLKTQLRLKDLPSKDGPTSKAWLLCRFLAVAIAQRIVNPGRFFPLGEKTVSRRSKNPKRVVDLQNDSVCAQRSDLGPRSLESNKK